MSCNICALGELLVDFAPVSVDNGWPVLAAHAGGAPANFLAAAHAAGAEASMLGKVGTDAFGGLLIKTLTDAGIDAGGVLRDGSVFTTMAFVTLDENGNRSFSFARKPGADTCIRADELALGRIDACDAFHFGTLSLTDEPAVSATKAAVAYAKARGKLVTFDPNLRESLWADLGKAKEAILWGLGQADIVKISDNEAAFLFGLAPEAAAEHIYEAFGAKLVFVTCGADGCRFKNRNAAGGAAAYSFGKAVDTTGAGDIFGGTAIAKVLLSGKAPEDLTGAEIENIASYAAKAAGISVTRYGGIPSIPTAEEVAAVAK